MSNTQPVIAEKTQEEAAADLLDAFELLETWEQRYRFLIDLGKDLPKLDDAQKTEDNRVHGCQSNVWMVADPHKPDDVNEPYMNFVAESDSSIVNGLIGMLREVYQGQPVSKVIRYDVDGLIDQLGLSHHLSMGRRNGLAGMIQRIRKLAAEAQAKTG